MKEFPSSMVTASLPLKVISGGQTGVDQAALEAALQMKIKIGGFCPLGRLSEKGPIPSHYPLIETPSTRYEERTLKNIQTSDGTLIIFEALPLSGGTKLTQDLAQKLKKPCLCLSFQDSLASTLYSNWTRQHHIQKLNVAGPRESHHPGIGRKAQDFLLQIWNSCPPQNGDYPSG